ncbi:MAG: AAA family ATPase, partial [Burkholderiales bacterium]|nr:AAA family ATPase [Burkholderiales bacterium]
MNASRNLDHYGSFLPETLIAHSMAGRLLPAQQAFAIEGQGVLLFADISGFTALAERFARNPQVGAEQLTDLLNYYFDGLIEQVTSHGGDIVKFAGDAMLILWSATSGQQAQLFAESAVACAHALQSVMSDYSGQRGESLSMKVAVSAGQIRQVYLGGLLDRREMILTGGAIAELGHANDHAKPGDVIVCDSAQALLLKSGDRTSAQAKKITTGNAPQRLHITESILQEVRPFIPAAIRKALDADQADWISENRQVSLLFVNLGDFSQALPIDLAQSAMQAMQMALYRFEGSLNKISVDDKGVSLLAALGMPPFAHADDPLRAVQAAKAIYEALLGLGLTSCIGVTTGRVFCGVVGSPLRREYTLMGDIVNLSARLMQAASKVKEGLPVVVDEATWRGARHVLAFEPENALKLKGKSEPVASYQLAPAAPASVLADFIASKGPVLGRDHELLELRAVGRRVFDDKRSYLLELLGEVGSGRTKLSEGVLPDLRRQGFFIVIAQCTAMQRQTPWALWQSVFKSLLLPGVGTDLPSAELRREVMSRFPNELRLLELSPLLEAVIPADWPDNRHTEGLSGEARAKATAGFLQSLFMTLSQLKPLCLWLRSVEWMDRASAELCNAVLKSSANTLLLCNRDAGFSDAGFWSLVGAGLDEQTATISLPPLLPEVLLQIACQVTACEKPPLKAAQVIADRANGSPLYAIQILSALLDNIDSDGSGQLPASIEGLIVSRIDKLPPDVSLSGKLAAVVTQAIELERVQAIHPANPDLEKLQSDCLRLTSAGFLNVARGSDSSNSASVRFANAPTQHAFYGLVPAVQRRSLHQQLATSMEAQVSTGTQRLEQLAYHWLKACETPFSASKEDLSLCAERACFHTLAQAKRNTRLGAMLEAELQFQQLIALCEQLQLPHLQEFQIDALLGISTVRASRFGWADNGAAEALDKARHLCTQSNRRSAVFNATRGLWQIKVGRSEYEASLKLAHELIEFAQLTPETDGSRNAMLAESKRALGTNYFWIGEFPNAKIYLNHALSSEAGDESAALDLTQDTEVSARGMLAWTLAVLGEKVEALK